MVLKIQADNLLGQNEVQLLRTMQSSLTTSLQERKLYIKTSCTPF